MNSDIPLRVELLCTELATINDLDDTDMLMQAFNDMKENATEVIIIHATIPNPVLLDNRITDNFRRILK